MRLNYLPHARSRMRQYKITEEEVEETVNNPHTNRPNKDGQGRWEAWRRIRGRWLMVIYGHGSDPLDIVNVISKRRGPRPS